MMECPLEATEVTDFGNRHEGDVYLTHRWQKHVHQTTTGAVIVPVHHVPPGSDIGKTHMYRRSPGGHAFECKQTLSDGDIDGSGDLNAGIVVEDTDGALYATGHSIPLRWTWSTLTRLYYRLPYANARHKRTNALFRSVDDGRSWEVLRDETDQATGDCPHPHNLYFDERTGLLWWLVGHDGVRLWTYDPEARIWDNMYEGTVIQQENRLPLAMTRAAGRLWLACEVSGPDGRQLFFSEDDGHNWTAVDHEFRNPHHADNDGLWAIAGQESANGGEVLYVAGGRTNTGRSFVEKSMDGGDKWHQVYSGQRKSDAWVTTIDDVLFLADGPGPLLGSQDQGETFEECFHFDHSETVRRPFVEGGIVEGMGSHFLVSKTRLFVVGTGDGK